MRVLVAMSGGVDSSVAAALLVEQGHEVVGATLKLWGGPSDSGCCSVADVEDARRVAQQLGIAHHVFNLTEEFDRKVVAPYVGEHARGRTPNPCIECNRSLKFDRLLHRADRLGFERLATGHHARVRRELGGGHTLRRGADAAKDQSYVLSMLGQEALARVLFPVGDMTKARRPGQRPPSRPAHGGQAGQPGRVLHRHVPRAGRASCPSGWNCTPPRWSTATDALPAPSTRLSSSPSVSGAAWDTGATASGAT